MPELSQQPKRQRLLTGNSSNTTHIRTIEDPEAKRKLRDSEAENFRLRKEFKEKQIKTTQLQQELSEARVKIGGMESALRCHNEDNRHTETLIAEREDRAKRAVEETKKIQKELAKLKKVSITYLVDYDSNMGAQNHQLLSWNHEWKRYAQEAIQETDDMRNQLADAQSYERLDWQVANDKATISNRLEELEVAGSRLEAANATIQLLKSKQTDIPKESESKLSDTMLPHDDDMEMADHESQIKVPASTAPTVDAGDVSMDQLHHWAPFSTANSIALKEPPDHLNPQSNDGLNMSSTMGSSAAGGGRALSVTPVVREELSTGVSGTATSQEQEEFYRQILNDPAEGNHGKPSSGPSELWNTEARPLSEMPSNVTASNTPISHSTVDTSVAQEEFYMQILNDPDKGNHGKPSSGPSQLRDTEARFSFQNFKGVASHAENTQPSIALNAQQSQELFRFTASPVMGQPFQLPRAPIRPRRRPLDVLLGAVSPCRTSAPPCNNLLNTLLHCGTRFADPGWYRAHDALLRMDPLARDDERGWVDPGCLRSIGGRGQVEDSIRRGPAHPDSSRISPLARDGERGWGVELDHLRPGIKRGRSEVSTTFMHRRSSFLSGLGIFFLSIRR
ncbi:hypothetical protein C8R43DRAFT_1132428 [Mycena crocata]|nr:hypothetical protein C8R43DRAFT_1132428 [Mycena crocata]